MKSEFFIGDEIRYYSSYDSPRYESDKKFIDETIEIARKYLKSLNKGAK